MFIYFIIALFINNIILIDTEGKNCIVLTTWNFIDASNKAWNVLNTGGSALDAVEKGATVCEEQQCDGTVGFGGSPDEEGETRLDAFIMDGKSMKIGAVGAIENVKAAISVARHVLEYTKHSFIVGKMATDFAIQMGFKTEPLATNNSINIWKKWHDNNCQPNFWMNVHPNPNEKCGPYTPAGENILQPEVRLIVDRYNHDTIGMVAIDKNNNIAAGTSTNGAKYKIPGRVGDSPIPGAGAYADNMVGGAAATGDGDVMMRFLPSFLAVEEMRRGTKPKEAVEIAIKRIKSYYPTFSGAVIALHKNGDYGAACHGFKKFPFVVQKSSESNLIYIDCVK